MGSIPYSAREIAEALNAHTANCDGDVVVETKDRWSLHFECIGRETSAVMECPWKMDIPYA